MSSPEQEVDKEVPSEEEKNNDMKDDEEKKEEIQEVPEEAFQNTQDKEKVEEMNTQENLVFNSVLELLDEGEIAATQLSSLRDLCKKVDQEHVHKLQIFLDSRFEETWVGVPTWAQSDKAIFKKKWITINCIKEVKEYIMSSNAPHFQPLIEIMEFPDHEQRQAAEKIYKELHEDDCKSFHAEVETEIRTRIERLPEKAKEAFTKEVRQSFLIENYLNLAQNYLTKKKAEKNFIFNPVVELKEISDQSQRERTALAYSKVRAEHDPIIKQEVEKSYERENIPTASWISKDMQETMKKEWMLSRYPEIVEAVVARHAKTPEPTQEIKKCSTKDITEMFIPAQMFYSPKKKTAHQLRKRK